jgi:hypothetical protein
VQLFIDGKSASSPWGPSKYHLTHGTGFGDFLIPPLISEDGTDDEIEFVLQHI